MSGLKKIFKILYPVIIWAGTIFIPLFVIAIGVIIFESKGDTSGDWQMLYLFGTISLYFSTPALILFAIVYYVCLLTRRSNKFIKTTLYITNILNILVTCTVVNGFFAGGTGTFFIIIIGSAILLIPSTLLITLLKIPQKKTEL